MIRCAMPDILHVLQSLLKPGSLIKSPKHDFQGRVLQRSCNVLTACAKVAVANGVEIATHEIDLKVCTEKQQVCKVKRYTLCPPLHTALRVDVRPKLTSNIVYQIFWCSPPQLSTSFLVFASCSALRTPTQCMVAVVRAAESPIGGSQFLVPMISSERRALNKHHDV